MQINKYLDIFGGVTLEDIAEGRMVFLTEYDEEGVYGVRLPDNADEAARCNNCVAWPPSNLEPPFMHPTPTWGTFALRKGFDRPANSPFNTDVSYVYPGNRENSTIPSGTVVRIFNTGAVITVTSGQFIASADLVKYAPLGVAYTGADAGKLQYDSRGTVAVVEEYDPEEMLLTFRIR